MNILFIIGNGFDLNLGLKTSYNDFYRYYNTIDSVSDKVKILKEDIFKNFDNWSDLELELGKYTDNIQTLEEFDEIFEDILEKLSLYLQKEEKKLDVSNLVSHKNNLLNNLLYPEDTLTDIDKNKLKAYKNRWSGHSWNVNIITFNYTKSLEKLLDYREKNIMIESNKYLREITHIHGYVDNRMVIGVNDKTQILNKTFHDNQDILDALVKQECNQACGHTIDNKCEKQILSANLICIFGSSIGDTDLKWWNLIGNQLKKGDCKLIIFEKAEDIPQLKEYRKDRIRRKVKLNFLDKTLLTNEEKKLVVENIFIGINTSVFNEIVSYE